MKSHGLYMGINLSPLLSPVDADFFRPTNETAFERARPGYVRSHKRKCYINFPGVKCRVGRAEEFDISC